MKIKFLLLGLVLTSQAYTQSYKKIHRKAIVVDTHNDILMKAADRGIVFDRDLTGTTHTDLTRWKKGGLDVQIFSVYCDGGLKNHLPLPIEKWIVSMQSWPVTRIKLKKFPTMPN